MIRNISKICNRYYLPVTIPVFTMLLAASGATAARYAGVEMGTRGGNDKVRSVKYPEFIDPVNKQRIKFAADHGVNDPAALVAAVRHSPMANLLISVAIEESRGDSVAVGAAGEQGAWQVKPASWGLVPQDIYGQASQAEKIISALLIRAKGNAIQALARYNGGSTPPVKSYRYAKRILKRMGYLHVAVNFLPHDYIKFREGLVDPHGNSWIL